MKQILKTTAVVITFLITFLNLNSCKQEEEILETQISNKQSFTIPLRTTFEKFKKENITFSEDGKFDKLQTYTNNQKQRKNSNDSGFIIDPENISKIEIGKYKSYTFKILNSKENTVENIVIEIQGKEIRATLLTYSLTKTEKFEIFHNIDNRNVRLEKPTRTTLDVNTFEPIFKGLKREGCYEMYVYVERDCASGQHHPGEEGCELSGSQRAYSGWEFQGWRCSSGGGGGGGTEFGDLSNDNGDLNPIPLFGTIPSWALNNTLPDFSITEFFPPEGSDIDVLLNYGPTNFTQEQQNFINDGNNSPIINYLANVFRITGYSELNTSIIKWIIDKLKSDSSLLDYYNLNPQELDKLTAILSIDLTNQQKDYLNLNPTLAIKLNIFLFENGNTNDNINFVKWVTQYFTQSTKVKYNQNFDVNDLKNIFSEYNNFEINKNIEDFDIYGTKDQTLELTLKLIENDFYNLNTEDAFVQSFDFIPPGSIIGQIAYAKLMKKIYEAKYAILKQENPNWGKWKLRWEASKDIIQIHLDFLGLIPVVGEVADITNGVIYTVTGDGVNASLSFSAAIPIAGWFATGTKFAKRVITLANGSKTTLYLLRNTNNLIEFGNRAQLRTVLQIGKGVAKQAHHIIPWGFRTNPAVQKAAQYAKAFHMNDPLNGIAIDNIRHFGSHPHYDGLISGYLNAIPANATPEQAYNAINSIINKVRTAIANNPNTHINQLNF